MIVPAFNEELNIIPSLEEFLRAGKDSGIDFEIIVIDDGSSDNTGNLVKSFIKNYNNIFLHQHLNNKGIGSGYRTGIENARFSHCMLLCGDNIISSESLLEILKKFGEADLVLPYIGNPGARSHIRRLLSYAYVTILNLLFGFNLKYYNGLHILPVHPLKKMDFTKSFAFSAQIVIRLLKSGYSYTDLPMDNRERSEGTTKAFQIKNVLNVILTIVFLFFEIYLPKRRQEN